MATTQYIGARYVPIFADPVEWDITRTYEHLMMVQHEGETYISQQAVPAGIQLPDVEHDHESNEYWVHMSNWNAQIEQYRQEVLAFNGRITTLEDDLPSSSFDSTNTVKKYIDDSIRANENLYYIDVDNPPDGFTALDKTASTGNSEKLQDMLDACGHDKDYIGVQFGIGSYEFDDGVTITENNVKMRGISNRETRLLYNGAANFIDISANADFTCENMGLYNNVKDTAIAFNMPNLKHFHFTHLQIHDFHIAFNIVNAVDSIGSSFFDDIFVADDYSHVSLTEFYFVYASGNVNAITMRDITMNGSNHNACVGYIAGGTDFWINNGNFAGTKNNSLNIDGSRGDIHVTDCIFDQSDGRAIRISNVNDWGVSISTCWFNNIANGTVTNESLIYVSNSTGVNITNSTFGNTLGDTHNGIYATGSQINVSNCSSDNVDNMFSIANSKASIVNCSMNRKNNTGAFCAVSSGSFIILVGNYSAEANLTSGAANGTIYGIMNAAPVIDSSIVTTGNYVIPV